NLQKLYFLVMTFLYALEAGTVDSVSAVGEVLAYFSIGRSAAAVDLANATDGLGALKTLIDTVNTDLSNSTDGLSALKALIDTVDLVVDAIKVKTDDLNFGVSGKVDANITHVNETEVDGTGASGDEWGPA
ncbi:hypothetical protein LCGC14_1104540, partial [marine sediment metagenome]